MEYLSIKKWISATCLFVLAIFLSPLLLFVFALAFVYRTIVQFEIWRRYSHLGPKESECGQLLHPKDSTVAYGIGDSGLCVVMTLSYLDRVPDLDRVKQEIMVDLVEAKDSSGRIRFTKLRMFMDSLYGLDFWNYDLNFDIESHVRSYDKLVIGQRQLQSALTEITNQPIPGKKKPVWEFVFVPYKNLELDPATKCVCVFRFHHAMTSGFALAKVMYETLLKPENGDSGQVKDMLHAMLSKYILTVPQTLVQRIYMTATSIFFMPHYVYDYLLNHDEDSILHCRRKTKKQVHMCTPERSFSIESLRAIRALRNCTFNDVFLSCAAGALRRYFVAKEAKIPATFSFLNAVLDGDALRPAVLINDVGGIIFRIRLDIPDPLDRLESVKRETSRLRTSPDLLISGLMSSLLYGFFPNWVTKLIVDELSGISGISSNVPPTIPIKFRMFGTNLELVKAIGSINQTSALLLTLSSADGNGYFTVVTDKWLEPDPDKLDDICRYFYEEIDLLLKMCK